MCNAGQYSHGIKLPAIDTSEISSDDIRPRMVGPESRVIWGEICVCIVNHKLWVD